MLLSLDQIVSDERKMIAYICERIPDDGCRVVLADGADGSAWADLTPLWDDERGWDLHVETDLPEWVTLRRIYEDFRDQDMTSSEREAATGLNGPSSAANGDSASVARLERKIDEILAALRRVAGNGDLAPPVESLDQASTLTKSEVARHLKISERTVDRLRAAGTDLGEMRIGGVIRFDPNKIKQAIAARKLRKMRS